MGRGKGGPPERLLGIFVDEALEGLETIAGCLRGGGEEGASIDRATRCAHSIAVNSRLLGLDHTAASADALEDILLACRATTGRLVAERAASVLVDVHALPIVIREELRRTSSLTSTAVLDGRIREIHELVSRPAGPTQGQGKARASRRPGPATGAGGPTDPKRPGSA